MTKLIVDQVHDHLLKAYGAPKNLTHPKGRPMDILVQSILGQNTSEENAMLAYRALRKQYPRWTMVAEATEEDITACIGHSGLAEIKSTRILTVMRLIRDREGRVTLSQLSKMSDREALKYLASLPGVGIKTASSVMLFGLSRPIMPVDTHVYRTAGRLGWLNGATKIEHAGKYLEGFIPKPLTLSMHLYLIEHGRQICKTRNPKCASCSINGYCKAFDEASGNGSGRKKGSK